MAAESVLKMTLVHAGQTQAETTMEIYNDDELRNESVDAQTPLLQLCAYGTSTGSGDWLDRMVDGRALSILREVSSRRNLSDSRETTGFRVVKKDFKHFKQEWRSRNGGRCKSDADRAQTLVTDLIMDGTRIVYPFRMQITKGRQFLCLTDPLDYHQPIITAQSHGGKTITPAGSSWHNIQYTQCALNERDAPEARYGMTGNAKG
ncbi:predicted protein [Histoplasma capsulatum var. duboisii H88]|uniref:Predicted protein n=2 Tax=Ajellomyces capsulatus TaxID=5037 RepID=F0UI10_AJEC8|nr:predicted protein [Histoplasma capsulatum H143]EGC46315.1 predicted protein [Histoplasma capsulatum var. duboisii H88]